MGLATIYKPPTLVFNGRAWAVFVSPEGGYASIRLKHMADEASDVTDIQVEIGAFEHVTDG